MVDKLGLGAYDKGMTDKKPEPDHSDKFGWQPGDLRPVTPPPKPPESNDDE